MKRVNECNMEASEGVYKNVKQFPFRFKPKNWKQVSWKNGNCQKVKGEHT